MKKYFLPFCLLGLVIAGCYYLFDESVRASAKAKSSFDSAQIKIDDMQNRRDRSSEQIIALNRSVKDSLDFLSKWKDYYAANRDYESIINKIAERTQCAVVGRKWDVRKTNLGKLDYDADVFTGMVVGDYRNIVKFIGELERDLGLSTIWSLEFKEGINEVACTINIFLPVFPFLGGGLL